MEYSAYPVISPNNRTFPSYFNQGRLTKTYVKKLIGGSNPYKQDVSLNITSPYPGYWFSAAFIDSNDQKVKPDLLRSNCSFYLTSSVNLWQINDTIVLYPNNTIYSTEHPGMFKIYKYLSVSLGSSITFDMNFQPHNSSSPNTCNLTALIKQSAFPDMKNYQNNNEYITCLSNTSLNCKITIDHTLINTWHYLGIISSCNYTLDVIISNNCLDEAQSSPFVNYSLLNFNPSVVFKPRLSQYCSKFSAPIETFRFIGPTYFSVKYYFNSNYNRSNAILVRNDKKPYFIEFLVDHANNGGTLNFYLVNNLIYDPNYESETRSIIQTISTSSSTSANNLNSTLMPNTSPTEAQPKVFFSTSQKT